MFSVPDTVPAVVLDVGAHSTKVGHAGDDLPRRVFSSAIASIVGDADGVAAASRRVLRGDAELLLARRGMQLESPCGPDGLIARWSVLEALLEHAFQTELVVDPTEFGVLITELAHAPRSSREKLGELLFERHNVPAAYVAKSAPLAAFASGRTSALVLELGASCTSAVPVVEGAVPASRSLRTPLGGNAVCGRLDAMLRDRGVTVRPEHHFTRVAMMSSKSRPGAAAAAAATSGGAASAVGGGTEDDEDRAYDVRETAFAASVLTSPSYEMWRRRRVLEEVLESGILRVAPFVSEAERVQQQQQQRAGLPSVPLPSANYFLPDGSKLELGRERHDVPNSYFEALPLFAAHAQYDASVRGQAEHAFGTAARGLSEMVQVTINRCDASLNRDLMSSVVLTGGCANIAGLSDRLSQELMYASNRARIIAAASPADRRFAAWTGGSILATFSEFQRMWVSKEEYFENGAVILHKKGI